VAVLNLPTLVVPASVDGITMGLPTLVVDGVPVEWPTMGEWRLEFSDDNVATLTLSIPVQVEVAT
jgi:hypothetical protein